MTSPTSNTPTRSMSQALNSHENPPSTSPRHSSQSLAAAASVNAAERRSSQTGGLGSPRLDRGGSRRRSQVAMTLNLNDPTVPGPGELSSSDPRRSSVANAFTSASPNTLAGRSTIATGDPHHHRQPSLGDIHNELEQEQEAQVNRMLFMIRAQQQQLDAAKAQHANAPQTGTSTTSNTAVIDELTPQSEQSFSFASAHPPSAMTVSSRPRLSREPSSASRSPALRPRPSQEIHNSGTEWWPPSPVTSSRRSSIRDESAYYQAETSNLQRENQMLRLRIRELEKQIQDKQHSPANTPAVPSHLTSSTT